MGFEWVRGPALGRGSFATVDLAIPSCSSGGSPPLMAVKSSESSKSATLRNEKWVLDQIGDCPQVIRCFGDDRSEKVYNLFLEYASGGSLADLMKKFGGKLPESEVRRHARSMLLGLSHIHDLGFVHCDLKIQNVLVFDNGDIKIGDFGLAKKTGESKQSSGDSKFELRGTPLYMSPESVAGGEQESPADIWALGCLVSEMVAGKPAWRCSPESNVFSLMMRIGAGAESPEIPENLSENGRDFLGKIFVNDPRKRWTAGELLGHPFVAGDSVSGDFSGQNSPSPRGPLDFPDWVSMGSSVATVGPWSEFDFVAGGGESPASRIDKLVGDVTDRRPDCSVSGSWVTVRE